MRSSRLASVSLALALAVGLLLALLAGACAAPAPAAVARDVTFVVMLDGAPAPGAAIFANGQPLPNALAGGSLTTGPDGRLTARLAGTEAVAALAPAALATTARPAHDWLAAPWQAFASSGQPPDWKYQVFWTSLDWDKTGAPVAASIGASETVTLTLHRQRPLILFNLLVSVEWDADQAYLDDLSLAMQRASTYLWDVTDGQMALGQVRIVANREHWWDADIQVVANNTLTPHALIGGMEEELEPAKYRVQLGPFWDSRRINGPDSRWSKPDGYRTIVHELGHYALGLYDEYVGSNGGNHACTGPQPDRSLESTGASVMNHQYTTSELSSDDVPGLWSLECEKTLQWQRTLHNGVGQSAWDAVVQRFSRAGQWEIVPPRQQPLSGPISTTWPTALMNVPAVVVENDSPEVGRVAPFTLTVATNNSLAAPSVVWLEQGKLGCAIKLGEITAARPRLWVLGARSGDRLHIRQEVDESGWHCATRPISDGAALANPVALQYHDFSCKPAFKVCDHPAPQERAASSVLLAQFDPPRQQLPSDVTWQTLTPLSFAMIPFSRDPSAIDTPGHDASFRDLLTTSAVNALVTGAAQGEAPPSSAPVCFAGAGNCLLLDVGVTANALSGAAALAPASQPARLTLASNDGLWQIFQQGSRIPADLFIVDSPLPPALNRNGLGLVGVSRLYTLGGAWNDVELAVQIQAGCCAGESERLPRLYRIENGEPTLVEDSWYVEQEGYVLATIRQPGAYALFR